MVRSRSRRLINGRKRHLVVDTRGLPLLVMVSPADLTDRDAAKEALFRRARVLWCGAVRGHGAGACWGFGGGCDAASPSRYRGGSPPSSLRPAPHCLAGGGQRRVVGSVRSPWAASGDLSAMPAAPGTPRPRRLADASGGDSSSPHPSGSAPAA
ncbi:transposase [Streptomyces sp. NPDC058293]|uniref:transposase n=1 Tax=Streptomyces sp. NPDC058293 TaxID=3346429 RepID=UPI0036E4FB5E